MASVFADIATECNALTEIKIGKRTIYCRQMSCLEREEYNSIVSASEKDGYRGTDKALVLRCVQDGEGIRITGEQFDALPGAVASVIARRCAEINCLTAESMKQLAKKLTGEQDCAA
jgi:hypothetical protein